MILEYFDAARSGNHVVYDCDLSKIRSPLLDWRLSYSPDGIFLDLYQGATKRRSQP